MTFRFTVKRLLRRLGYDIVKFDTSHSGMLRRMLLLKHHNINLVFDVGANQGLYAHDLRRHNYTGRIVSFEPLKAPYAQLEQRAHGDALWETANLALGAENTSATIHVADNVESSSILDMLPQHLESAPQAEYTGEEQIEVRTLDSEFPTYYRHGEQVYLKIDTQGYERFVLEGANQSLDAIRGIQIEMSLVPLYDGEMLYREVIDYMDARGFKLVSLEPGFSDAKTGQLLQVDGLFFRA